MNDLDLDQICYWGRGTGFFLCLVVSGILTDFLT